MKIGIDCRGIRNFTDGIGKYSLRLIEGLSGIDNENQYYLFFRDDYKGRKEYGVNFHSVTIQYPHLSWQTMYAMGRQINSYNLDVYHSPFFLLPYGINCKTVITVPDIMALKVPGFFSGRSWLGEKLAYLFHKTFVPDSIRRADRIIVISQATGEDILGNITGIDPNKIKVTHLGVDEKFKPKHDSSNRVTQQYFLKAPYYLYVGNTKPYKDISTLVAAYRQYKANGGKSYLQLVSFRDRFRDVISKKIQDEGLEKEILFQENVCDNDLATIISGAIAFIFPSIYEGFGLPVVEAMACGCPVITTNIPSIKEITGDAAVLVTPGDSESIKRFMMKIESDKSYRDELVHKGLRNSARFTWRKYSQNTLDCYRTVNQTQ